MFGSSSDTQYSIFRLQYAAINMEIVESLVEGILNVLNHSKVSKWNCLCMKYNLQFYQDKVDNIFPQIWK